MRKLRVKMLGARQEQGSSPTKTDSNWNFKLVNLASIVDAFDDVIVIVTAAIAPKKMQEQRHESEAHSPRESEVVMVEN